MIAFLIDADNFSAPTWVNEAFQAIERTEGSVAIRRAYGSAENLKGLAEMLRIWAVRPFVNLPLPKNTTDMSLAVDAMELACSAPHPKLMVIASGDLDFVPLVVRLRERGIKVVCISERSRMAQDAIPAYDQVIYVGTDQVVRSAEDVVKAKPVTPAITHAAPKKSVPKIPTVKITVTSAVAAKKAPAKKAAKKTAGATMETVKVPQILGAVPNLKAGQWQPLGDVAKVLHDEKLLAKSAASTKLFKRFPHHFELKPAGKPNQVRYILPPQ